jgi:DNA processing protein
MRPRDGSQRFPPDELLGPLNAVERQNAPEWLYVAGDTSLLGQEPRVAIVGARNPTADGQRRAARLARELVGQKVVVVSGLARGIDAAAHTAAIQAGGRTIAVLGTPLDVCYPRENAELQKHIMKNHLAVSQFPEGYPTGRTNFPRRNRTMALLTHATVIVEAREGSGTLSQGWEALRLGRELFVLKSVVETPSLAWPKEMLRYGARVLGATEELLPTLPPPVDVLVSAAAF